MWSHFTPASLTRKVRLEGSVPSTQKSASGMGVQPLSRWVTCLAIPGRPLLTSCFPCHSSLSTKPSFELRTNHTAPALPQMGSHWAPPGGHAASPEGRKISAWSATLDTPGVWIRAVAGAHFPASLKGGGAARKGPRLCLTLLGRPRVKKRSEDKAAVTLS